MGILTSLKLATGKKLLLTGIVAKQFITPQRTLATYSPFSFGGPTRKVPFNQSFSDIRVEFLLMNNNQYHTPQLTFAAFVASRTAIFGLKVERSVEVLEVSLKISDVVVVEMLFTHCLNVLEGEVPDVYLSGLN